MTIYSAFTLQPKFRSCLQMTCSSFVRIFARLLLTSFENVLSHMCHHSVNNYCEAFQQFQIFLKYILGTVYMKLVYKYRACMLSKPTNQLFTSSTFLHVKSKCMCIFLNSANNVFRQDVFIALWQIYQYTLKLQLASYVWCILSEEIIVNLL